MRLQQEDSEEFVRLLRAAGPLPPLPYVNRHNCEPMRPVPGTEKLIGQRCGTYKDTPDYTQGGR